MQTFLYLLFSLWLVPTPLGQTDASIELTIRLRAMDGAPVVNQPILLERLPDAAALPPACRTNNNGWCTWQATSGLYQVLFPGYPLDAVSALAVAEGGLGGLGVTVGEVSIQYTFVLYADGHIYFDTTPNAAAPSPFIPVLDGIQGGTPPLVAGFPPAATLPPTGYPVLLASTPPAPAANRLPRHLWGYALLGAALGAGRVWWGRRRTAQTRPPANN